MFDAPLFFISDTGALRSFCHLKMVALKTVSTSCQSVLLKGSGGPIRTDPSEPAHCIFINIVVDIALVHLISLHPHELLMPGMKFRFEHPPTLPP